MSSHVGKNIRISLFGQSHSEALGVVIDGLAPGIPLDLDELRSFLERRAPGRLPWSTSRKEADAAELLSGIVNGRSCGAPIAVLIRNLDARSQDYEGFKHIPRPGHADYVAELKYRGFQDAAGGGHFSARLMAPFCAAGGIALQALKAQGICVGAHAARIAGIDDDAFPSRGLTAAELAAPGAKPMPVIDDVAGRRMEQAVMEARAAGDSVGGVVECAAVGLPAGLGEPIFDGIESLLARMLFSIPAVKGVEFGCGFAAADMRGSRHNDAYRMQDGAPAFQSNHAGGALGGISTGEPLVFRVAFKPVPSIAQEQESIHLVRGEDATLSVRGRHDPCVVPRAVPIVEAACALVLLDLLMESRMR